MPDVPAIVEAGITAYPYGRMQLMTFITAPAALPPSLREALTNLLREAVLSAPFQARAEEDAYLADALAGEALADAIAHSYAAIREAQTRARL